MCKRNEELTVILRNALSIENSTVVEVNTKTISYVIAGKNKVKHISVSDVIVDTMLYLSKLNDVKTKFRINNEIDGISYTLRFTTLCKKPLYKITTDVWLDTVVKGYFTYLELVKEGKI